MAFYFFIFHVKNDPPLKWWITEGFFNGFDKEKNVKFLFPQINILCNPKVKEQQTFSTPKNSIHPYHHQARKEKEPQNNLPNKTGGDSVGVLVGRSSTQ